MASQTSTQYDNAVTNLLTSGIQNRPTDALGKSRELRATHTLSSGIAATETLTLFTLPQGAKVSSMEIIQPASMTTTDGNVGISSDDNVYADAVNFNTLGAGRHQLITTAAAAQYVTTQAESVLITVVTGTMLNGAAIEVICRYTVE